MNFFNGQKEVSRFKLYGFEFEKEVTFCETSVELKITCKNTSAVVFNEFIKDFWEWASILDCVRSSIYQYIEENATDQEKLFAYFTSNEVNHDLYDQ